VLLISSKPTALARTLYELLVPTSENRPLSSVVREVTIPRELERVTSAPGIAAWSLSTTVPEIRISLAGKTFCAAAVVKIELTTKRTKAACRQRWLNHREG